MDCSPPGSSVHGIFQAGIMEWVPFPSPRDLPNPVVEPASSTLQADSLPLNHLGSSSEISQRQIRYHVYTVIFVSWCFRAVVLEKTLESPLDSKEIKPVHPKGNESWIFIGRTDAEALILWPPDGKNWLVGKDLDAGKDWRQEEKGTTEDEMARWRHRLDGHEFE